MNARHFIFGIGGAVALVGAALVWRTQASPAASNTPSQPAAVTVTPPTPSGAACQLAVGETFAFSYQSQTQYRITTQLPGAPDPVAQEAKVELTGRLDFEVIAPSGIEGREAATVLGRLTHVNDAAKRQAGEPLENAFLAQVDARCEVTAFARLKTTPGLAARAQQVALTDLAFSVGDGTKVAEATFLTSLGTLRALAVAGNEEPGHFVRKPLNYTSRWSPRMDGVELVDGLVDVRRGGSAWFEHLRGEEQVAGGQVDFSKTRWEVHAVPHEAGALASASRDVADYVWVNALAMEQAAERSQLGAPSEDHAKRVEAARGVTWDQAFDRFGVLVASGANINEQWRDMAAFLDAHPDKIEDFVDTVTDAEFPAGAKAPAFLALGQAQTPVARQALLGIYRDRESGMADRIRSSLALVGRIDVGAPLAKELRAEATRRPTSTSEAAVSRQALLHLGVLAGTHPGQADVAQEATEVVQQLTATAKTPEDYSVLCGMVGNMAELSLLPQIATWTRLADPALRQKVPHALRRYRVDRVHDLTVEWLARETDFDVKRELFNVIHHMYVDANRPIGEALKREAIRHLREAPLVLTRQSLYHLLAPHVADPEVHTLLKAQLLVELKERSGLYSLVAQDLPAASVFEVLSTVDGLRSQFAGELKPVETPGAAPPPTVEREPDPPEGFEAAMRGAE